NQHSVLGLPLLCFVRIRGDVLGGDCRCPAGVLLFDCSFGRSHVIRRPCRPAPGNWLDHGNPGFCIRSVLLGFAGSSHRSDDRLYLRSGAGGDVLRSFVVLSSTRNTRNGGGFLSGQSKRASSTAGTLGSSPISCAKQRKWEPASL